MSSSKRYEAVIIGSGFGGAVTACRLAKKWPGGQVLVLERGRRYPLGGYPRSPADMAANVWHLPEHEQRPRPRHMRRIKRPLRGMFDVRTYPKMDVVVGAGLGDGSLIYANVIMEPPALVFDE